jgi:hypothetical protein
VVCPSDTAQLAGRMTHSDAPCPGPDSQEQFCNALKG